MGGRSQTAKMADADRRAVVERSRERSERLLSAALDPFDDPPVLDPLVVEPPRYFDDSFPASLDAQRDRWAGIGGANVFDSRDGDPQVLCVKPGYKDRWEGPGGDQEPGESLPETARREVREETNYEVELTGVFYARHVDIDYGPPAPVRIPMAIYTAEPVAGRLAVPAHRVPSGEPEIEDARWFRADELPADLLDRERIREHLASLG